MMNVLNATPFPLQKVVMIGAGRVASHLAPALHAHGVQFVQVYSRTMASSQLLAEKLDAEAVDCRIYDWRSNESITYKSVKEGR